MNKFLSFLIILILFFTITPLSAGAKDAFLYFAPSDRDFEVGEEFIVSVKVNTGGAPINAVKATLYFPNDKLSILDISKDGSIFTLWPEEPQFSNESGKASFVGGIPHPGFTGTNGQTLSIKFKAKARGKANINFGESAILADDGKGTDIFAYSQKGNYIFSVPAPAIFSSTHPSEGKWYSNSNPEFRWELSSEITDVSFILDKNLNTEPDKISEGRLNSQAYKEVADGIWYFHLRTKDNLEWSSVRHFSASVDTNPPRLFEIAVNNEGDPTNPRPILCFDISDGTSGIDYYRINFENGDSIILANPGINQYQLPLQEPGTKPIVVQAYDKAGNFRENSTGVVIRPIKEPIVTIWPRTYVAGEERLYVEGEALPKVEVTIFLEKENDIRKEWKTQANEKGEWTFSTADILKSGIYYLFTKARDQRGALSNLSSKNEMEVAFSGITLGSLLITFRSLVSILVILLLILFVFAIYFIWRSLKHRKTLKKETTEAAEILHQGFSELKKDIIDELEKLEGVKSKQELDEKEKEIIANLKNDLKEVEKYIGKEIKDVEKELG